MALVVLNFTDKVQLFTQSNSAAKMTLVVTNCDGDSSSLDNLQPFEGRIRLGQ